MPFEVKVPTIGESISTGTIGAWRKKNGEFVKDGDILFEIETDKVTSEVYAENSGVLEHLFEEGTEVEIGAVVARIDETKQPSIKNGSETSASAQNGSSSKKEKVPPEPISSPVNKAQEPTSNLSETLSPAVRHLITENHLDPLAIEGSGKDGRILKADVLQHLETLKSGKSIALPTATSAFIKPKLDKLVSSPRSTRRRMSQLRRKIADRLVTAQQEAAMLTTFNEVDMTNVMATRKQFQERFVNKHGVKLGFMSFFVKAAVYALQSVPGVNSQIDGEEVVQNHYFDIGVAISTEKGLLVPVLRDCEAKSLATLEQDIIGYAKKARDSKITLNDLEGGVFTITNGGVFGSMMSTPILNAPQCAILGMHAINERPVAINGQVVIRPMMYLALSYDHRLVDGKEAVTFLVRIKEFIENPTVGLLDF
ncbi:MAG: 2-oxoglutarate dehydrogenase complex dihydrolipoyllysine-residue succinyltransferase [Verrucomicrobiota bacterium]